MAMKKYPTPAVRSRKERGGTSHDLLQNVSIPQSEDLLKCIMKTLCRAIAVSTFSETTSHPPRATSYNTKPSIAS